MPPKLQIDIDNDMLNKLLKAAHYLITAQSSNNTNSLKSNYLAIFNEAQIQLVKELLPYWSNLLLSIYQLFRNINFFSS